MEEQVNQTGEGRVETVQLRRILDVSHRNHQASKCSATQQWYASVQFAGGGQRRDIGNPWQSNPGPLRNACPIERITAIYAQNRKPAALI